MEYLEIGKRIKAIREEKGISQKDAAQQIGIQQSTLSKYERGKQNPRFQELCLMADWFGVSVDYLLCRTEIVSIPTDGKLQAAAEVTGLSSTALKALSFLYSDKELEILSALLATGNFPKILALIAAKCESIEKGNSNAIAGIINILPQKVEVFGSEFQVKPELLADSLIQTEFLRAVDSICSQYIKEENHNGKHQ